MNGCPIHEKPKKYMHFRNETIPPAAINIKQHLQKDDSLISYVGGAKKCMAYSLNE